MRTPWLLALLAACGRYGFETTGISGVGDGDAGTDATAGPVRPNVAFVTSGTTPGNFGGLAQGDALCATAASNGQLAGAFKAWLSTSTVNAIDRFTGSRGWVRVDGAPIADTMADMVIGKMFNAINLDENGVLAPIEAWSGTTAAFGMVGTIGTCTDWTATTGFGTTQLVQYAMVPGLGEVGGGCAGDEALLCLEVGHDVTVAPVSETGRLVFTSSTQVTGAQGVAMFDSVCNIDALAAGRSGTFRAAVATTTASIASRFTADARPWVRVDGTRVGDPTSFFAVTGGVRSFADQRLDGTYVARGVWLGALDAQSNATSNCNNWSSSAGGSVPVGYPFVVGATFWGTGVSANNCSDNWNLLCLEQ